MINHKLTRLFTLVLMIAAVAFQLGQAKPIYAAETHKTTQKSAGQVVGWYNQPTDQIIVKYRPIALTLAMVRPSAAPQMQRLSAAAGLQMTYLREMSGSGHVMRLASRMPLEQVQAAADRLKALPEVEYAEPDAIKFHTMTPNDPYYSNQWHYLAPTVGNYGINAPAAWDITTGVSSVVVGVIDTGITNHADLAGQTVPGYDFIADIQTANDGNGRDADPSDPGDWEVANECYTNSPALNSSWHGTHTAGTIGAKGNNGLGVTGVSWGAKILPVRVLGKCGGYTSDIVDGMRWAAGLAVAGVPTNANPAKVLSISLGGYGVCESSEQNAINAVTDAGVTVVVAAGNNTDDASNYSPASCNRVITVGATDRNGSRASYSNYGATVEISAPGGEQGFANDPNGVLSTLNTGTTVPVGDTYGYYQGTSMATPHVAGVVALMYSLHPTLSPQQILDYLQASVIAFPDATCNTSICGKGILNAGASVASVSGVVPTVTNTPTPTSTPTSTPPSVNTIKNIYLPIVSGPSTPFTGQVTDNGAPVGGITLTMRYSADNGSSYTTYATTTTAADGTFRFADTPPVDGIKKFYVRFDNTSKNPYWLNSFMCYSVTSTNKDYFCAINLHDIGMVSPNSGATVGLPYTFTWNARGTTTDSYVWSAYDWTTGDYLGETSEVGYTNAISIYWLSTSIFQPYHMYGWSIDAYTPEGAAVGYFIRAVTFSNLNYNSTSVLSPQFSGDLQSAKQTRFNVGSGKMQDPERMPKQQPQDK